MPPSAGSLSVARLFNTAVGVALCTACLITLSFGDHHPNAGHVDGECVQRLPDCTTAVPKTGVRRAATLCIWARNARVASWHWQGCPGAERMQGNRCLEKLVDASTTGVSVAGCVVLRDIV